MEARYREEDEEIIQKERKRRRETERGETTRAKECLKNRERPSKRKVRQYLDVI